MGKALRVCISSFNPENPEVGVGVIVPFIDAKSYQPRVTQANLGPALSSTQHYS